MYMTTDIYYFPNSGDYFKYDYYGVNGTAKHF